MACRARSTGFLLLSSIAVALLAFLLACTRVVIPPGIPALDLKSTSFSGNTISKACTCDGQEKSPELSWSAPPAGTQSFALLVNDRDSLFGYSFVHWVLYDVPAETRELAEGTGKQARLPDGSYQGTNDDDKIGYLGPCPPGKSAHHYVFALYALDTKLNLPPGATRKQVVKAMNGHIVAAAQLVGEYRR